MINPVGFCQDLPPSVFAGGFHSQYGEAALVESKIVVFSNTGKKKVRFGFIFSDRCALVPNSTFDEYLFKMVFQGQANATLATVLHRQ